MAGNETDSPEAIRLQIYGLKEHRTFFVSAHALATIWAKFQDAVIRVGPPDELEVRIGNVDPLDVDSFLETMENWDNTSQVTLTNCCRLVVLGFQLNLWWIDGKAVDKFVVAHLNDLPKCEIKELFLYLAKNQSRTSVFDDLRKYILDNWTRAERMKLKLPVYVTLEMQDALVTRPDPSRTPRSQEEPERRVPSEEKPLVFHFEQREAATEVDSPARPSTSNSTPNRRRNSSPSYPESPKRTRSRTEPREVVDHIEQGTARRHFKSVEIGRFFIREPQFGIHKDLAEILREGEPQKHSISGLVRFVLRKAIPVQYLSLFALSTTSASDDFVLFKSAIAITAFVAAAMDLPLDDSLKKKVNLAIGHLFADKRVTLKRKSVRIFQQMSTGDESVVLPSSSTLTLRTPQSSAPANTSSNPS